MVNECKLIKDLPSGGQKNVQLAEHPQNGLVVIKKGDIKSFTSLERIRREIELLSELQSEFYPKQFHFKIDITTKEFEIIEQYIEGATLRDKMESLKTPEQIFTLLHSLIEGLSIIWDRNIVHRDLKPENIIIREDGKPCIIDLGIARFLDLEELTKTIAAMGPATPIYAAPEQLTNKKSIIGQRTDFFCLGIVSLELFLGVHPFDPSFVNNHFSTVENILKNNFLLETETVQADHRMNALADKTLRTQPFERFRNYHLFREFIEKHLTR